MTCSTDRAAVYVLEATWRRERMIAGDDGYLTPQVEHAGRYHHGSF